jgi:hypothetical protein
MSFIRKRRRTPDLDAALREWRSGRRERSELSPAARARILRYSALSRELRIRPERAVPLFFPARRLALATALPVLVLSLMVGYLLIPGGAMQTAESGGGPVLQAVRQGDEVIFTIADGGGSHMVRKSRTPNALEDCETFVVSDGAFRDRLDSGGGLVFYRID